VHARDDPDLRPDVAHLIGPATIETSRFLDDPLANQFLGEGSQRGLDLFLLLREVLGQPLDQVGFDVGQLRPPVGLLLDLDGLEHPGLALGADPLEELFAVVDEQRVIRLFAPDGAFGLAALLRQLALELDGFGNVRLRELDAVGKKLLVGSNRAVIDEIEEIL
jgi:hypothetical protein